MPTNQHKKTDQRIKTEHEFEDINLKNSPTNYYIVKKNGKWGVITENFDWYIQPKYEKINFDFRSREFECLKENLQNDCFW